MKSFKILKLLILLVLFLTCSINIPISAITPDDSIEFKAYTQIKVDLAKGGLTSSYLPFDVPFVLTGKIPEGVYRVAVIYGESQFFESSFNPDFKDLLIDQIADSIKKIDDITQFIKSKNKANKIAFNLYDRLPSHLEIPFETNVDTLFFLNIQPLKPNVSYRFFLHYYSMDRKDIGQTIATEIVDEFMDVGNKSIYLAEADSLTFSEMLTKSIDKTFYDKLLVSLDDFIKNKKHYKNINIKKVDDFKTYGNFNSVLIRNKYTDSYLRLQELYVQFHDIYFKKFEQHQIGIENSDLGKKFFTDLTLEMLYLESTQADHFQQRMRQVIYDQGQYSQGIKNFETNKFDNKLTLGQLYTRKKIQQRIDNIELYQQNINQLKADCKTILTNNSFLGLKILFGDNILTDNIENLNNNKTMIESQLSAVKTAHSNLMIIRDSLILIDELIDKYNLEIVNYDNSILTEQDIDKKIKLKTAKLKIVEAKIKLLHKQSLLNLKLPPATTLQSIDDKLNEYKIEIDNLNIQHTAISRNLDAASASLNAQKNTLNDELTIWIRELHAISNNLNLLIDKLNQYATTLDAIKSKWATVANDLIDGISYSQFYQLTGISGSDYISRANYYVSADVGLAYLNFQTYPGVITPYLGVNFNLRAINRQAHYNIFGKRNKWNGQKHGAPPIIKGMSIMLGFSYTNFTDNFDNRSSVLDRGSNKSKLNVLTGIGLRLSDHSRISSGVSWTYFEKNPDLSNSKLLSPNYFISFSLDVDVKRHLGGIQNLFNPTL